MDYLQEDYYPQPPPPHLHDPTVSATSPHTPHPNAQSRGGPPESSSRSPISPDDVDMTTTTPIDPNDPYNSMPPPPSPSVYPSLSDLLEACQSHARAHGYACVTSSNNYKRGIAYVRCDRGGTYSNHWHLTPETRRRHNRTRRLVGCEWKARAKRLKGSEEWELRMMVDRHTGHGPSGDARKHPSLRKLGDDAVEVARDMFLKEKKTPKEVLGRLREWNEWVTAQDVYNLKAKIVRESTGGADGVAVADGDAAAAATNENGDAAESATPTPGLGKRKRGAGRASKVGAGAAAATTVPGAIVSGAMTIDANDDDDAVPLDPALQMPVNLGGGGAPQARMVCPESEAASTNPNANLNNTNDGAMAGGDDSSQGKKKGKCACTCCEH